MSLSPPWILALFVAAATAILALLDLRATRAAKPIPFVAPLTHLLAGGLIGYLPMAFFPALPLVAAIGGMLTIRAIQSSRWTDVSLVAVGFGCSWTLLIGWRIINDRLDPAVHAGDQTMPFTLGAAVLVGGLLLLAGRAFRPESVTRTR